jgi:hypothetical protein
MMKEPVLFGRKFLSILPLFFLLFDIAPLMGTPPRPLLWRLYTSLPGGPCKPAAE